MARQQSLTFYDGTRVQVQVFAVECYSCSDDVSFALQINPEHGCCYIPYGGEEIAKEQYQVLVIDKMRLKH